MKAGRRGSAESAVQGYFLSFRAPQEEEEEENVMFQNVRKTLEKAFPKGFRLPVIW